MEKLQAVGRERGRAGEVGTCLTEAVTGVCAGDVGGLGGELALLQCDTGDFAHPPISTSPRYVRA